MSQGNLGFDVLDEGEDTHNDVSQVQDDRESSQSDNTVQPKEPEGIQLRPRTRESEQNNSDTAPARSSSATARPVTKPIRNEKGQFVGSVSLLEGRKKRKRPPTGRPRGRPRKDAGRETTPRQRKESSAESSSDEDDRWVEEEMNTSRRSKGRSKSSDVANLHNQMATLTAIVEKLSLKLDGQKEQSNPRVHGQEDQSRSTGYHQRQAPQNVSYIPYHERPFIQTLKTIEPPKFNGDIDEAVMWLLNFKEVATTNLWSEEMRLRQLPQSLTHGAKSWFRTTWMYSLPSTWIEFETQFKQTFLRSGINDHLRVKLSNLKQGPDQDLLQYYFKATELCLLTDANMPAFQQINYIIDGMLPRPRRAIRMIDPQTGLDLQRAVKNWLADNKVEENRSNSDQRKGSGRTTTTNRGSEEPNSRFKPENAWCANCGKKGHLTRECPDPFDLEKVRARKAEWAKRSERRQTQGPKEEPKARLLNSLEPPCPEGEDKEETLNRVKAQTPPLQAEPPRGFHLKSLLVAGKSNEATRIRCRINGQLEDAVLDTGASITVVPMSLIESTRSELYKWSWDSVSLADGARLTPAGWSVVSIEYRGRTHTVSAAVLERAPDVLIGCDFHEKARLVISYEDNVAMYHDEYAKFLERYRARVAPKMTDALIQTEDNPEQRIHAASIKHKETAKEEQELYVEYPKMPKEIKISRISVPEPDMIDVKSRKKLIIPAGARARVEVKTSISGSKDYLIESIDASKLQVIPGIGRSKATMVDVVNVTKVPMYVGRREVIARATSLEKAPEAEPQQADIAADLAPDQKAKLKELLNKHEDLFVSSNDAIGIVPFMRHRIDTGSAEPIRSKPYRVSLAEQKIIQDLIDEMLEAGIIRPSRSYWASPVVLVKKKGTTELRFCVDYRKVNKVTKVDPYPIPNMDTVLETLSGNHWFSKLDVKSMYWQVLMEDESRSKTAFVVHCGQFEFNVMPFGLVSAPMTAMRVMNEVTKGLDKTCFVFYDDILVFTPTFDQHLEALNDLMSRLGEANIKLNSKKCDFALNSVRYLGHDITAEGIRPDPTKVEAIQVFKTPKSMTEARSFVGMTNFFRRYIKGYATIARPIHDTISVNKPFKWTPEAQKAMDELKLKLTTPPLLVHFDPEGKLTIRCDASGYGLGAILLQKSSEKLKSGVIAYSSRTLSSSERNYATTHKECLAVVHAVKHWRHYLYGKEFEVVTDHHALCWLMRTKDHQNQLMRWSLILQEYQFTIRYESGKIHDDADCLSRYPTDVKLDRSEEEIPTWPIHRISLSLSTFKQRQTMLDELAQPVFDVVREQRSDEYCSTIVSTLVDPNATKKAKRPYKHFMVNEEILYRRSKSNPRQLVLVLPQTMVDYVLQEAHDKPIGGHFGMKRTLDTIKARFYWRTLDTDVRHYVRSCDPCQRKKHGDGKKRGFMIPMPIPKQVFQVLGMDLMGPLPASANRNQYVLVVTDYLSKYVITKALRSITSARILEVLRKDVFYKHGVPSIIISDNGSNLTSQQIRDAFRTLGIRHKTTTPYRPQTNGQTERYNRVLGTQLTIYAENKPKLWDRYLHALTFAYNTTTHASHLTSPYFLMYGRNPLKPIDHVVERPLELREQGEEAVNEAEALEQAREFARQLIKASQLRAKESFDRNRVKPTYKLNDLVLIDRSLKSRGDKKKLAELPKKGPYRIIKMISDVNYQVQSVANPEEEFVVHIQQMWPYTSRRSVSDEGKQMTNGDQQDLNLSESH